MKLDEALSLASLVESSGHSVVIAIGRFLMQQELQAAHKQGYLHKFEWSLTVMAVNDLDDRAKIDSIAEWNEFAAGKQQKAAKSTQAKPPQTTQPIEHQFLLF